MPVISGGFCVGCGACKFACPDGVRMARDSDGVMQAEITDETLAAQTPSGVCVFSDATPNETTLAQRLFPDASENTDKLGRFETAYAGHVADSERRATGSSGALTSWVAAELLAQGKVDAVIHVHADQGDAIRPLFGYAVSRSIDDVWAGAKTRYYSVEFSEALQDCVDRGERFALIGVPCFIKAARHLADHNPALGALFKYGLSLICGHMKAPGFAESLAWQSGVPPQDIAAVDFRFKLEGRPANRYGFETQPKGAQAPVVKPMSELVGRNWDGGYFRLQACDFCDDVVGETADVAFGDAWLSAYDKDHRGTSIALVRHPEITAIMQQAADSGVLSLDALPADLVERSQAAGFRDRRSALQLRLKDTDLAGRWRPEKRVEPGAKHLNPVRRMTVRLRVWTRKRSFAAYRLSRRVGSIWPYTAEMTLYHAGLKLLSLIERKLRLRNG